jgi:hypothetical protein
MKKTLLLIPVVAMLTACGSTRLADVSSKDAIPAGPQQAISEQKLTNNFKRQGVKIVYSWSGKLEAIETTGYAPVWGGSQNASREAFRVAELEAKKALNDFINKETITSSTSVLMISRNLEKARDNKTNKFATNKSRDEVASIASDDDSDNKGELNSEQNVAIRNDALSIASRVRTNISVRNQGILGGLYLVESDIINNGKTVRVVYRWDEKHTPIRQNLRTLMSQ